MMSGLERVKMRISNSCMECLYDKQARLTDNENYLSEIRKLLAERREEDTSPYMVYLFHQVYEKYFGKEQPYAEIKKRYNDLILSMEHTIKKQIEQAGDSLAMSLFLARIGNYIDFGAMSNVDDDVLMELFSNIQISEADKKTYQAFLKECEKADTFLLLCDNCGEIVLDKLMIEQLKERFPRLKVTVMVRGGEVLNDATMEDAVYVGMDSVAEIITNGESVAGTVYEMLPLKAKEAIDYADVILSKGQGNYESISGQGRHIFYTFLCKCDLFTERFGVPKLTGIFVEESL